MPRGERILRAEDVLAVPGLVQNGEYSCYIVSPS